MNTQISLKNFLLQRYTRSSANCYEREIKLFLQALPNAQNADYNCLIAYLSQLRKSQKPHSIQRILQAIKKYYNYLIYNKIREDNPAQAIRLRDNKKPPAQLQDLLEEEQMQALWSYFLNQKYRYNLLKNRNISIAGLLLFQALQTEEICQLQVQDLDLAAATLRIYDSKLNIHRVLNLDATQILPLHQYLQQDRPKLLKKESNLLFISNLGNPTSADNIHYLISTAQKLLPLHKLCPMTLRMSRLALLFKQGWSLRRVQLFAGHRCPSSTERYRASGLDALKNSILRHHPLE